MRRSPDQMREGLNLALIEIGNEWTREAKITKKYQERSGSATRSIGYLINRIGKNLSMVFGAPIGDPTNATITENGVSYIKYLHDGTKPHEIRPKNAKALNFGGKFYKKVNHPGTKPDQFIYRAVENKKRFAIEVITKAISRVIKRI